MAAIEEISTFEDAPYPVIKLGELCETTSGGTPSRKRAEFFSGSIPWIKSGELNDALITESEEHISDAALAESTAKIFPAGTLLVALYGATVGKTGVLAIDAATNQAVCAIFPGPSILRDYVWWYLRYKRPDFLRASIGGAQPNINQRVIQNTQIPLPPLSEQRRIVARIEELAGRIERARGLRREAAEEIAALDDATKRVVFDTNTFLGWPAVELGHISEIRSGVTLGRKLNGATVRVPYLRVANVQDGRLDLREIKEVDVLPEEVDKWRLQSGDILMTEGGDWDKLGRGTVWNGEIPDCIHQNHIFRLRADPSSFEPRFLSALIGSSYGKRYFQAAAKQTTNLASINQRQLRAFKVFQPPLDEQRRIVAYLDGVQARAEAVRRLQAESAAELAALLPAVLARAFRGEL